MLRVFLFYDLQLELLVDSGNKMSNLCSRIVSKPPKRPTEARDSMSVAQTNAWMNGNDRISVNKLLIYSNRMILYFRHVFYRNRLFGICTGGFPLSCAYYFLCSSILRAVYLMINMIIICNGLVRFTLLKIVANNPSTHNSTGFW